MPGGWKLSERGPRLGARWTQRPLNLAVQGWAKFLHLSTFLLWPVIRILGALLTISAYPNAPLLSPAHSNSEQKDPHSPGSSSSIQAATKWPFVIFSHGLGGSRTGYSHYCTQLASDGYVVLAMEHHDGSGVYATVRSSTADSSQQGSAILYIEPDEVEYSTEVVDESTLAMPLRLDQLAVRREEIYNAVAAFRQFVESPRSKHGLYGIGDDERICTSPLQSWETWENAVRLEDNIFIAGHSFGGSTLLSILSNPPPTSPSGDGFNPLPITKAIAMDPWLEPFPTPGPTLPKPDSQSTFDNPPQLLIINSEGFTLWGEHFDRIEGLAKTWGDGPKKACTLLTLPTALHINFSDFPLFLPRRPRDRQGNARSLLSIVHRLSSRFLAGDLGQATGDKSGFLGELRKEGRLRSLEVELIPGKQQVDEKGTLSWKGRKLKGTTGDVVLI